MEAPAFAEPLDAAGFGAPDSWGVGERGGGKSLGRPWWVRAGFLSDRQAWLEGRREKASGAGGKPNAGCFVGNG